MTTSIKQAKSATCHLCEMPAVELLPGYENRNRVSSDRRPLPKGGRICICRNCGCVQKVVDETWLAETREIYDSYVMYQQAGGTDQAVFDQNSGQAASRSVRLLERLFACEPPQRTGRLLDVGCGNGALLRAYSKLAPEWSLMGTELDNRHRSLIESIPGVEYLHNGPPDEAPGVFDIITMIHVIEHIPSPQMVLASLGKKLAPDGLLVIEAPDYKKNPFDLIIADHCTHFCKKTIAGLLEKAGYEIVYIATDWIPKEISVVARKTGKTVKQSRQEIVVRSHPAALCIDWLEAVLETACKCSKTSPFGIFGTSIAAAWIFTELNGHVDFFVDEDSHCIAGGCLSRPVYLPREVPAGSAVFMPMPSQVAIALKARLKPSITNWELVLPPLNENDWQL